MFRLKVFYHELTRNREEKEKLEQESEINLNSETDASHILDKISIKKSFTFSKNEIETGFFLLLFIIILIFVKNYIPAYENIVMVYPFGQIVILFLSFYGFWRNNDLLAGLGIVSIINTFVFGAYCFLAENTYSVFYLFGIMIGMVNFLTKKLRDWRIALLDALIYLIFFIALDMSYPLDLLPEVSFLAIIFTKALVVFFPFCMVFFEYLKGLDNFTQKQVNSISYTKYDQYIIDNLPQYPLQLWHLIFVVVAQFLFAILSHLITSNWVQFATVSTWCFSICVVICYCRDYELNSAVASVIMPIMWLILLDYTFPTNFIDFFDLFFHLLIIYAGFYVISRRYVRWDYIFAIGFCALLYGFGLNSIYPGYLRAHALGLIYFVICNQIILSLLTYKWIKEEIEKNNEKEIKNAETYSDA